MARKTYRRKTHRSKSHKRRHSRRQTRKNGGACGCAMRSQFGGRGGLGGAELDHAYTTGASQELYQRIGNTPGLSSGGGKVSRKNKQREQELARRAAERAAANAQRRAIIKSISENAAKEARIRTRHKNFKKVFMGMPIRGHEGNEYKHLSRNEIKNKIREEALSKYVEMFENNEGFNTLNLELNNNNNNNNNNNMGKVIVAASANYVPKLNNLRRKTKRNNY